MRNQYPTTPDDPVLRALAASAQTLDADPAAAINPVFQRYGRAILLQATARSAAARPPVAPVMRRLVSVGIAVLIFVAISVPVLAGPGAVVETVTEAVRAVVVYTGLPLGNLGAERASLTTQRPAASPTPPSALNPAGVSDVAAATATPLPTPVDTTVSQPSPTPVAPRGQPVREGAREPTSQDQPTATPTPPPAAGRRGKPDEPPAKPEPDDPAKQPGNPDPGKPEDTPGKPDHGKPDEPPGKPDPGPPATPPGNPNRNQPAPPTATLEPPPATPAPPTATPKPPKPDPAPKPAPKPGDKSRDNGKGGGKR